MEPLRTYARFPTHRPSSRHNKPQPYNRPECSHNYLHSFPSTSFDNDNKTSPHKQIYSNGQLCNQDVLYDCLKKFVIPNSSGFNGNIQKNDYANKTAKDKKEDGQSSNLTYSTKLSTFNSSLQMNSNFQFSDEEEEEEEEEEYDDNDNVEIKTLEKSKNLWKISDIIETEDEEVYQNFKKIDNLNEGNIISSSIDNANVKSSRNIEIINTGEIKCKIPIREPDAIGANDNWSKGLKKDDNGNSVYESISNNFVFDDKNAISNTLKQFNYNDDANRKSILKMKNDMLKEPRNNLNSWFKNTSQYFDRANKRKLSLCDTNNPIKFPNLYSSKEEIKGVKYQGPNSPEAIQDSVHPENMNGKNNMNKEFLSYQFKDLALAQPRDERCEKKVSKLEENSNSCKIIPKRTVEQSENEEPNDKNNSCLEIDKLERDMIDDENDEIKYIDDDNEEKCDEDDNKYIENPKERKIENEDDYDCHPVKDDGCSKGRARRLRPRSYR